MSLRLIARVDETLEAQTHLRGIDRIAAVSIAIV
jgi:hypothetical protein